MNTTTWTPVLKVLVENKMQGSSFAKTSLDEDPLVRIMYLKRQQKSQGIGSGMTYMWEKKTPTVNIWHDFNTKVISDSTHT